MQSPSLLVHQVNWAMAYCAGSIDKTAFDPSRGILVGCWQGNPTTVKAFFFFFFFADSLPTTGTVNSPDGVLRKLQKFHVECFNQ